MSAIPRVAPDAALVVGVDVGGTFTDCVVVDDNGRVECGKVPTTPEDRAEGFFGALAEAGGRLGLSLEELLSRCRRLVHGTTTGTNALVTRSGARVGLVTTAGHGDVLAIMTGSGRSIGRPADQLTDLLASRDKAAPFVPAQLTVEVEERVDRDGDVVVPLDAGRARDVLGSLLSRGVEAVAISLLWSIKNPVHELALREIVHELDPDLFVSCGSELAGRRGEYERTAAAVMNAYLGPLMAGYVHRIEKGVRDLGYGGPLFFTQCAGGAMRAEDARRFPLLTVNSGPVTGVMGSARFSEEIGVPDLLTTDMGGTTFDVSLIRRHAPMFRDLSVVERNRVAISMLDVESIGAGGGSIAQVDASGRLTVGPGSAGADPGPVCYRRGGVEPTVTDADLVLGRIDPGSFLHGRYAVDRDAAERAIGNLGQKLGLGVLETAAGIVQIVDANMADCLRRMSEFRGVDPRGLVMVAFGGSGPVHAAACARLVGIPRVIIPVPWLAPVWSAVGAASSDITHLLLESTVLPLPAPAEEVAKVLTGVIQRAQEVLERDGFPPDHRLIRSALRMKYRVQIHDVEVPVGGTLETPPEAAQLEADFRSIYAERYGENAGFEDGGIEISGVQVQGVGCTPKLSLLATADLAARGGGISEKARPVYWPEQQRLTSTPVVRISGLWDRAHAGSLAGPCLLELPDTVVVVPPGQRAELDARGFVSIQVTTG